MCIETSEMPLTTKKDYVSMCLKINLKEKNESGLKTKN